MTQDRKKIYLVSGIGPGTGLRAKQRMSELMFYVLKQGKLLDKNIALFGEENILVSKKIGVGISDMGHLQ